LAITHRKAPGTAHGHRRHDFVVLAGGRQAPVPRPPTGLLVRSQRRWEAFWRSEVAQVIDLGSDLPALRRWIQASDEFERTVGLIAGTGRLVQGSMGQPVLNPLYGLLRDLHAQITRAESEFGMTPMARLRLGLSIGELKLQAQRLRQGQAALADPDRRAAILADDA
jgi:P27 family predicted phage terminase small subunit